MIVANIRSLPASDDILELLRRIYVQSSTPKMKKQDSENHHRHHGSQASNAAWNSSGA
jgi:hypothetical protein